MPIRTQVRLARPLLGAAATTLSATLSASLAASSALAGGTLTAVGLGGYDLVRVVPTGASPIEIATTVNPAAPFATSSFQACAFPPIGVPKACLDATASFVGLTAEGQFTSFRLDGVMNVATLQSAQAAIAQQTRELTFTVSGTSIWDPFEFRVAASFTEMVPSAAPVVAQLFNGNGTLMLTLGSGQFDTLLSVPDGTYRLTLTSTANLASGQSPTSGFVDYLITVTPADTTCGGPGAGDCLSAHGAPNCDDADCCQVLCATLDPSCCQIAWDASCVELAEANCLLDGPAYGPIIDPITGRRYSVYERAPRSFAYAALLADGWSPGLVKNERLHRWAQRTLSTASSPYYGVLRIGLSDDLSEGSFVWFDGEPASFAPWHPGEPNDYGNAEDCVEMLYGEGWNDYDCSAHRATLAEELPVSCGSGGPALEVHGPGCDDPVVCSIVCLDRPECCTIAWDDACVTIASGLIDPIVEAGPFINPANRHRYWILSKSSVVLARRAAASLGGTLAIPNSQAEQEWILSMIPLPFGSYFIGINDELIEGSFRTELGDTLAFTAWAEDEPNDWMASEDVVVLNMSLFDGKWNDLTGRWPERAIVEANCLGDLTDDGSVDGADLSLLLGAWGGVGGDLTGDSVTDGADLSVLLGAWGSCPTS